MRSYNAFLRTTAEHDLRKLDKQIISRIIAAVDSLEENPFPPGHRRVKGKKKRSKYHFIRIRVGDYRIIYQVNTRKKEIDVWYIRLRDDAY